MQWKMEYVRVSHVLLDPLMGTQKRRYRMIDVAYVVSRRRRDSSGENRQTEKLMSWNGRHISISASNRRPRGKGAVANQPGAMTLSLFH